MNNELLASLVKFIGFIIIGLGIIGGFYIGFTLEEVSILATNKLHPLRWIYGFSVILSTAVTGLILLIGSQLITYLDTFQFKFDEIDRKVRNIEQKLE